TAQFKTLLNLFLRTFCTFFASSATTQDKFPLVRLLHHPILADILDLRWGKTPRNFL
ncbi:hypothetical protein JMJ77_0004878, partial [Colletotrichum scovillei]